MYLRWEKCLNFEKEIWFDSGKSMWKIIGEYRPGDTARGKKVRRDYEALCRCSDAPVMLYTAKRVVYLMTES